jgi:hypothetical protein
MRNGFGPNTASQPGDADGIVNPIVTGCHSNNVTGGGKTAGTVDAASCQLCGLSRQDI